MSETVLAWGEMPYDGKTPREVVDDYVLIRGDLVAEYARAQLALWIERYADESRAAALEQAADELDTAFGSSRANAYRIEAWLRDRVARRPPS